MAIQGRGSRQIIDECNPALSWQHRQSPVHSRLPTFVLRIGGALNLLSDSYMPQDGLRGTPLHTSPCKATTASVGSSVRQRSLMRLVVPTLQSTLCLASFHGLSYCRLPLVAYLLTISIRSWLSSPDRAHCYLFCALSPLKHRCFRLPQNAFIFATKCVKTPFVCTSNSSSIKTYNCSFTNKPAIP